VERRHELVLGVERNECDTRQGAARLLGVDADLGGEYDECGLGGVTDDRFVVGDGGVAAQRQAECQAGEVGCGFTGGSEDGARGGVAAAFDLVPGTAIFRSPR
jgi:hypothetical protein